MNFGDLIPISLFICIAYSIKVCVDAMVRRHMVNAGGSEELVNSVLRDENLRRRHSSLRWGTVLLSVALGFGEPFFAAAQAEMDRHCRLEFARGARIVPGGMSGCTRTGMSNPPSTLNGL